MQLQPVTSELVLERAIQRAAHLLSGSRFPVIAGLKTDIAGVVAAIRLAEKLGGAIDHVAALATLRDGAVLHDTGLMLINPSEARRRADTWLFIGDPPSTLPPDFVGYLFTHGHAAGDAHLIVVSNRQARPDFSARTILHLDTAEHSVAAVLAALRAVVNGRPLARDFAVGPIRDAAKRLREAKYGVAVWNPAELDLLAIEMLAGLIKDLNASTRWSGLSVAADPTAAGAALACGWMAGFPLRIGFGRGYAEHDAWRFDAQRLIESGEADVAIWISTFGEVPPAWLDQAPSVLISDMPAGSTSTRDVALHVGRPGRDHDAVLYDVRAGALVDQKTSAPSNLPSAADVLNRISKRLFAS